MGNLYASNTKTTYKKSEELYKKILGRLKTDWGFDEVEIEIYVIKRTEVHDKSKEVLENVLNELNQLIDANILNKVEKKLREVLEILQKDIEGYKGMQEDVLTSRQIRQVAIDKELLEVNNFLAITQKTSKRIEVTKNMLPKGTNNE